MLTYHIKGFIIIVLYYVLNLLPKTKLISRLHRILYIKRLSRIDEDRAEVEMARDLGVKVGNDCRFYGVIWGPEPYLIEIGNRVLISNDVAFVTHDGGVFIFKKEVNDIAGHFGKIKIGNNCFIGYRTIILPNVQIGDNCIIAAGSVVAESFPDNSVIMGNPAKVIFKTDLFKKMKLSSKLTIRNSEYPFPAFDIDMPHDIRKKIVLESIDHLPIRKPRK